MSSETELNNGAEAPPPPYETKEQQLYRKYDGIWILMATVHIIFGISDILIDLDPWVSDLNKTFLVVSAIFKSCYSYLLYVIYIYAMRNGYETADIWSTNMWATLAVIVCAGGMQMLISFSGTASMLFYVMFGLYAGIVIILLIFTAVIKYLILIERS